MMYYAVDYAPSDVTNVCFWDFGSEPQVLTFGSNMREKEDFINGLNSDDVLYIELGGPTNRFVLSVYDQGCRVFRIPTSRLKQERVKKALSSEKDHLLMYLLSRETPDLFYPFLEPDKAVVELQFLVSAREKAQQARKQAVQRLTAAYQDLTLLEEQRFSDSELEAQVLSLPGIQEALRQEEKFTDRVERAVRNLDVYQAVFAPINGCGPQIGALLIAGIEDIRRFPSRENLANYTTYGFFKGVDDGTTGVPKLKRYARKYNGLNANLALSQAVWKFTRQVWRYGRHNWLGKQMILARLAKERENNPGLVYPHCVARALRWYGQKFLHLVYSRWNAFLEEGNLKRYVAEMRARSKTWIKHNWGYVEAGLCLMQSS
ncbi:MAG: hypothetical protein ACOC6Q_01930 [Patescibacteria group bacterium]